MNISRENDKLTISETPGCLWIFGLLFVLVGGLFAYGALGGFKDFERQSLWLLALALVFGVIGVIAGIRVISDAPITRVVIDRARGIVIWTKFGFMGRETLIYRLEDVSCFCLVDDRDSEGAEIWWFGMELVSGEILRIGSVASHVEEHERRFVFAANEFAGLQPSATELVLEEWSDEDH